MVFGSLRVLYKCKQMRADSGARLERDGEQEKHFNRNKNYIYVCTTLKRSFVFGFSSKGSPNFHRI